MGTLLSSFCQLKLAVGQSCLSYILILELNFFTGTAYHRVLPTYSLIFLSTWMTQLRTITT